MYERDRYTDGQTHRRTPHDGISRACIASRGKNDIDAHQIRSRYSLIMSDWHFRSTVFPRALEWRHVTSEAECDKSCKPFLSIYYRATYAQRGLCRRKMSVRLSVRLSVRPSVTRRYSAETAKRIIKLFLPSGSHTTLVFPNQTIPVCNDTIIVLKITPLHSVSVITNFVISKRDKQKKQTRNQYASPPRGNAIPTGPLSDSQLNSNLLKNGS